MQLTLTALVETPKLPMTVGGKKRIFCQKHRSLCVGCFVYIKP